MNNLLQESWDILKKNPNLYAPPALLLLFSGFLDPTEASVTPFYIISIFCYIFVNIALTTGWIHEIKVVLAGKEHKAKFDDVLIGIGKYFSIILTGNIFFVLLLLILLMGYLSSTKLIIGMTQEKVQSFQQIWHTLQAMKQEEAIKYISGLNPEMIALAYKWAISLFIFLGLASLFYFFIGLWAQCCVFRGISWLDGWKRSYKIVKSNFGIYTLITLLQTGLIFILLIFSLFLTDDFTQILLTIVNIVTKTYFTILFCLFIFKFDDDHRIDLIKDEIQSPVSEIQKPNNKE